MSTTPHCKNCGAVFNLYGVGHFGKSDTFKHWCPRTGREHFESVHNSDAGRAALTESKANAASYSEHEDSEY